MLSVLSVSFLIYIYIYMNVYGGVYIVGGKQVTAIIDLNSEGGHMIKILG